VTPPLTVKAEEIDEIVDRLALGLKDVESLLRADVSTP
jgi:acetylornithine/succinyldiaminopimelate/putrescine aminotransferase